MAKQRVSQIEFNHGAVVFLKDGQRAPRSIVKMDEADLAVDEELGVAYVGTDRYSLHAGEVKRWRTVQVDAHQIAKDRKAAEAEKKSLK